MDFTSEKRLDDGVLERGFTLGEIPGTLWTPDIRASTADPGRASRRTAPDVPPAGGAGPQRGGVRVRFGRHRTPRRAVTGPARPPPSRPAPTCARRWTAGEPVDEIVDALVLPLVEKAVPEWQATLDAVLSLPEIGGPVGMSGGVIAIGIRLALVEPRIAAALLFAGSFVPRTMFEEARRVTIPLQVLLQWDDEGNDRQMALDLFDAFGSKEKTLHANLGGHTGVPSFELDAAARFFVRHLCQPSDGPVDSQ